MDNPRRAQGGHRVGAERVLSGSSLENAHRCMAPPWREPEVAESEGEMKESRTKFGGAAENLKGVYMLLKVRCARTPS